MTRGSVTSAKLVAYIPYYNDQRTGFVLPLLVDEEGKLCIQITDDYTGKISEFRLLEYTAETIYGISPTSVRVGDGQLFVFLIASGGHLVGNLDELRKPLEELVSSGSVSAAVSLQISELCGSYQDKRESRNAFAEFLFNTSGSRDIALSLFESIASSEMWERELLSSNRRLTRTQLQRYRTELKLDTVISDGLRLHEDYLGLKARLRPQQQIEATRYSYEGRDIEETRVLGPGRRVDQIFLAGPWQRPGPAIRVVDSKVVFDNCQTIFSFNRTESSTIINVTVADGVKEMASQIITTPRQEERIAILLSFILFDRKYWQVLVDGYYYDRARFARTALGFIKRSSLGKEGLAIREFRIVDMIDKLFKQGFMDGKARFLVGVARYMGRDPDVKNLIIDIYRKNSNLFIMRHGPEIERYIN